jgi:urease accessory protein
MSLATLLVLADGRLPAGGHAHSGGLEAQVAARRVVSLDDVAGFLRGKLHTSGLVAAAFAAAACRRPGEWAALDDGLDARTPSPALRKASRAQGRALLRAGRAMWPLPPAGPAPAGRSNGAACAGRSNGAAFAGRSNGAAFAGRSNGAAFAGRSNGAGLMAVRRDPHQPTALGVLARAAGLGPGEAAVAAAHGVVTGAASAAVRLLGLDPYAVHGLIARLAPDGDRIAAEAARRAGEPVDDLPAAGAPLLDIGAEHHATWEVRLFAS